MLSLPAFLARVPCPRCLPRAAGLPVMVWIQSGTSELSSTAAYDGSRFARDVVVWVVINWRPGAEDSSTSATA